MSRKILVDRLDSTCVIKRLEGPVGGMVAGMDETFCETGRCSEFGGEMATAGDGTHPVEATSTEL